MNEEKFLISVWFGDASVYWQRLFDAVIKNNKIDGGIEIRNYSKYLLKKSSSPEIEEFINFSHHLNDLNFHYDGHKEMWGEDMPSRLEWIRQEVKEYCTKFNLIYKEEYFGNPKDLEGKVVDIFSRQK